MLRRLRAAWFTVTTAPWALLIAAGMLAGAPRWWIVPDTAFLVLWAVVADLWRSTAATWRQTAEKTAESRDAWYQTAEERRRTLELWRGDR